MLERLELPAKDGPEVAPRTAALLARPDVASLLRTARLVGNRAMAAALAARRPLQRPPAPLLQRNIDYGAYRALVGSKEPKTPLLTLLNQYSDSLRSRAPGGSFYSVVDTLDRIEELCRAERVSAPPGVAPDAHVAALVKIQADLDADRVRFTGTTDLGAVREAANKGHATALAKLIQTASDPTQLANYLTGTYPPGPVHEAVKSALEGRAPAEGGPSEGQLAALQLRVQKYSGNPHPSSQEGTFGHLLNYFFYEITPSTGKLDTTHPALELLGRVMEVEEEADVEPEKREAKIRRLKLLGHEEQKEILTKLMKAGTKPMPAVALGEKMTEASIKPAPEDTAREKFAIAWRSDSRGHEDIAKVGGFLASTHDAARAQAVGLNEPWNPFADKPGALFRQTSDDNCLFSVVSVGQALGDVGRFPRLDEQIERKDPRLRHVDDTTEYDGQVYMLKVKEGYDTKGHQQSPWGKGEFGVTKIGVPDILAMVKFTRYQKPGQPTFTIRVTGVEILAEGGLEAATGKATAKVITAFLAEAQSQGVKGGEDAGAPQGAAAKEEARQQKARHEAHDIRASDQRMYLRERTAVMQLIHDGVANGALRLIPRADLVDEPTFTSTPAERLAREMWDRWIRWDDGEAFPAPLSSSPAVPELIRVLENDAAERRHFGARVARYRNAAALLEQLSMSGLLVRASGSVTFADLTLRREDFLSALRTDAKLVERAKKAIEAKKSEKEAEVAAQAGKITPLEAGKLADRAIEYGAVRPAPSGEGIVVPGNATVFKAQPELAKAIEDNVIKVSVLGPLADRAKAVRETVDKAARPGAGGPLAGQKVVRGAPLTYDTVRYDDRERLEWALQDSQALFEQFKAATDAAKPAWEGDPVAAADAAHKKGLLVVTETFQGKTTNTKRQLHETGSQGILKNKRLWVIAATGLKDKEGQDRTWGNRGALLDDIRTDAELRKYLGA